MNSGRGYRVTLCVLLPLLLLSPACCETMRSQAREGDQGSMPMENIDTVLKNQENELLAIPGVVGAYVGLLPDGRTPGLKVMVIRKTKDLEARIPKWIDGYAVRIVKTGPIRPLKAPGSS